MLKHTLRSLPLIQNQAQLLQYLQTWRKHVSKNLQRPAAPAIPWNFNATNMRGGIMLSWAPVPNADGYQILRTDNGDFSGGPNSNLTVITLSSNQVTGPNAVAASYFDSLGGSATTKWYKIRATTGTPDAPQSISGNASGIVKHTSIDSTNTGATSTVVRDNATKQTSQTRSGGVTTKGGTGSGGGGMGFDGAGGGVGGNL